MEDWYRTADWDPADFERRLARSRRWSRPQYLRIKALSLLETGNSDLRAPAIALLRRLYEDYPDAQIESPTAPEYLGNALRADGQLERAADLYLEAIERQKSANVTGMPALRLVDLVLAEDLVDYYERVIEILLDPDFEALLNSQQFMHARDVAVLAHRLGRRELAAEHATRALTLAATRTEPQFPRHKTVGLIETDEPTLTRLQRIASV